MGCFHQLCLLYDLKKKPQPSASLFSSVSSLEGATYEDEGAINFIFIPCLCSFFLPVPLTSSWWHYIGTQIEFGSVGGFCLLIGSSFFSLLPSAWSRFVIDAKPITVWILFDFLSERFTILP